MAHRQQPVHLFDVHRIGRGDRRRDEQRVGKVSGRVDEEEGQLANGNGEEKRVREEVDALRGVEQVDDVQRDDRTDYREGRRVDGCGVGGVSGVEEELHQ